MDVSVEYTQRPQEALKRTPADFLHLFCTRLRSESGGAGVLVVFPSGMASVSVWTETWKESELGAGPAGAAGVLSVFRSSAFWESRWNFRGLAEIRQWHMVELRDRSWDIHLSVHPQILACKLTAVCHGALNYLTFKQCSFVVLKKRLFLIK